MDAFIKKWNGKKADYDGAYGGECVDLYNFYMRDVFKLDPYRYGGVNGAKDLATNLPKYPELEWKTTGKPPKGAIVVFGEEVGSTFGHVGMALTSKPGEFRIFDQIGSEIGANELPAGIRDQIDMKPYMLGYAIKKGADMYKGHTAKYWYDKNQETIKKLNKVRTQRSKFATMISKIKSIIGG